MLVTKNEAFYTPKNPRFWLWDTLQITAPVTNLRLYRPDGTNYRDFSRREKIWEFSRQIFCIEINRLKLHNTKMNTNKIANFPRKETCHNCSPAPRLFRIFPTLNSEIFLRKRFTHFFCANFAHQYRQQVILNFVRAPMTAGKYQPKIPNQNPTTFPSLLPTFHFLPARLWTRQTYSGFSEFPSKRGNSDKLAAEIGGTARRTKSKDVRNMTRNPGVQNVGPSVSDMQLQFQTGDRSEQSLLVAVKCTARKRPTLCNKKLKKS